MRKLILFSLLLWVVLPLASANEVTATAKIHNMDLRNCLGKNCIQMRAEHAESGTMTPLMSLKNVQVDFYSSGKKSTYLSPYGYIDFERNVVSIRVNPKKEMLFDLNEMSLYHFSL